MRLVARTMARTVKAIRSMGGWLLMSLLLLLTVVGVVSAQEGYTLGRYTIEHSGAVATGDGYTLVAAVGQADAGALSGGGFVLVGGFLAGAPVEPEQPTPKHDIFLPRLGQ